VLQKLPLMKQQKIVPDGLQYVVPPLPPCEHMQPFMAAPVEGVLPYQHTHDASEQPRKQIASALLQLLPT
jgi:hypothetical protein